MSNLDRKLDLAIELAEDNLGNQFCPSCKSGEVVLMDDGFHCETCDKHWKIEEGE